MVKGVYVLVGLTVSGLYHHRNDRLIIFADL
jgi:hypothetical protein